MFSFMIDYDKIVYAHVMVRLDAEFTNRTSRDGQKKKEIYRMLNLQAWSWS